MWLNLDIQRFAVGSSRGVLLTSDLQSSYDRVAENYAEQFRDEMLRKPFDRKILDWLAEKVDGSGVICDMGCGPGQIARYLHARGVEVCGVDLSHEMVRQAQRLNPGISFQQGDMFALADVADDLLERGLAAVVARAAQQHDSVSVAHRLGLEQFERIS